MDEGERGSVRSHSEVALVPDGANHVPRLVDVDVEDLNEGLHHRHVQLDGLQDYGGDLLAVEGSISRHPA